MFTNSICVTPKKRGCNELSDVRYIILFFPLIYSYLLFIFVYKLLIFLFLSSRQNKKRYNPCTIGDLSPSHFDTPRKAKRNLEMVKCMFNQQNVNLKKQVKRLQVKLRTYNDLIRQLKYKNFISENINMSDNIFTQ